MTECARCGDCCEVITFNVWRHRQQDWVRKYLKAPDPSDDERWENWWKGDGKWTDEHRDDAIRTWYNTHFIVRHWISIGDEEATCDMFDPATRLCTAHDQRPAICSNFPWYSDDKPSAKALTGGSASLRCSFWLDVPKKDWIDGVNPLRTPLTPVRIRNVHPKCA